jgi:hypothetical protein
VHTLRFKVSDSAGYSYDHTISVTVRNRAPYLITNITNANYSAILNSITTITLPTIVSPDLGSPWVRISSPQSFVSIEGKGAEIVMRVNPKNFFEDINLHNVSLEVFIADYPNTTKYWVNIRIVNTPPKFDSALADQEMGLY